LPSDTFLLGWLGLGKLAVQRKFLKNPTAWLDAVAKNKAKNHLQRQQLFKNKISPNLSSTAEEKTDPDIDLVR
jgi:DNA-directed RNA polymerase specialized sigma24 family protein